MSDIQFFLLEEDSRSSEAIAISRRTASQLANKQLALVDLIQDLGEYLNNEDATLRSKTMAYLAEVLQALPTKVLSRQQRDLLNDFVLSRIANGADALGNCARCLVALEKLGKFDHDRVITVVKTILDHASPLVHCKQQRERFEVLTLLDVIFEKYREVLKSHNEESESFMPTLIAFFDGEKDPRNLMIVFSIWNVIMVEWDVSKDAQALFDAVFNYFPITFRPPPDDPYKITSQQLKDRLKDCLASTSMFAPYSFPALLDKLDSTSNNVKRDALQTLSACASRYGPGTIDNYSITLWDAVKFEILSVQEEDLADEALLVLFEVARTLSSSTHDGPLQTYLKPIAKECNEHLEDTPTKQSTASSRILSQVSKASPQSSNLITRLVLPQIFALHKSAKNLPGRRGLLEILVALIDSNVTVYGHWRKILVRDTSQDVSMAPPPTIKQISNDMKEFSEQSVIVLSGALTLSPVEEVSFRLLALEGLHGLVGIRGLLDDSTIATIITSFIDIVIKEQSYGRDEVKAACIEALVQIAHQKPQLLVETALPVLMVQLPDTDTVLHDKCYVLALETFAKLTAEQQIFDTIMIRLKNKFYDAVRQNASSSYLLSILKAILYGFSHGAVDLKSPAIFGEYYQGLVVPLLKDVVGSTKTESNQDTAVRDLAVLEAIGRISNVIIRSQPWVSQTEMSRNVYTLFQDIDIEIAPPFATSDSIEKGYTTMIVSTHLIAALRREAKPHLDMTLLFSTLTHFIHQSSIPASARYAAVRQLAIIANKFLKPMDTTTLISPYLTPESPSSLISPQTATPISLHAAFSILQALILRMDPAISQLLPNILSTFANPAHGRVCARVFASLLSDNDLDILNKENHCLVYALRKQRFFSLAIPLLTTAYRENQPLPDTLELRKNYLIALTGTLQHVPYTLIQPSLTELTPLLLQTLSLFAPTTSNSTDQTTTATTLSLFSNIIVHDPKLVESHAGSLIHRLLDVASTPSATQQAKPAPSHQSNDTAARVRAAALTCLTAFVSTSGTTAEDGSIAHTALRRELLMPLQKEVVKRLSVGACDDTRRAVRAEAVRCRSVWLGLEGGDRDD